MRRKSIEKDKRNGLRKRARRVLASSLIPLLLGCSFGPVGTLHAADFTVGANQTYISLNALQNPVVMTTGNDTIKLANDLSDELGMKFSADQILSLGSTDGQTVRKVTSAVDSTVFEIDSGADFTLSLDDIDFSACTGTTGAGGVIFAGDSDSTVTLAGTATFDTNKTADGGGAVHVTGDLLLVNPGSGSSHFVFSKNESTKGGAIDVDNDFTLSTGATFNKNVATGFGGAVYTGGNVLINNTASGQNVQFNENSAMYGGAIGADGNVTISGNVTFLNNTAKYDSTVTDSGCGGAVCTDGNVVIADPTGGNVNVYFIDNTACDGGAIATRGDLTISTNATFYNNVASDTGGAIAVFSSDNGASTVTINPGKDKRVLFVGNVVGTTGNYTANSIAFYDDSASASAVPETYKLNITPAADGTVFLLDPVSVDLSASNKNFEMNVDGQGYVDLGGKNTFEMGEGTATVNFTSGDVFLTNYFALENKNDATNIQIAGDASGLKLTIELTGRDKDLSLFGKSVVDVKSDDANARCTLALRVDDFSDINETKYLVADAGSTIDTGDFLLATPEFVTAGFVTDAAGTTYIVSKNHADDIIAASESPNVRAARQAIEHTWSDVALDVRNQIGEDGTNAIFHELVTNTQLYLAEGIVGQAFGAIDWTTQSADKLYEFDRLGNQLQSCCCPMKKDPCERRLRTWGGYLGSDAKVDGGDGLAGFKQSWNGIMVGASLDGFGGSTIGGYFNGAEGRDRVKDLNTRLENTCYGGGIYTILRPAQDWSFTADISYNYFKNDGSRSNAAGYYEGEMNQNIFTAGFMLRRDFVRDSSSIITPLLGLRYQHLSQGDYHESTPWGITSLANHLDGFDADSLQSYLGVSYTRGVELPHGAILNPLLYATWRHEYLDNGFSTIGSFAGTAGEKFVIRSADRGRDFADLGLTFSVTVEELTMSLGYNASLACDYLSHSWHAGLSWRF